MEGLSKQSLGFDPNLTFLTIATFERHGLEARHICDKPRHRKTSFFWIIQVVLLYDFGIVDDEQFTRVWLVHVFRRLDNVKANRRANLWRSEPHAVRRVHGLEHVIHQLLEVAVKRLDGLGGFFEDILAVLYDGVDHEPSKPPDLLHISFEITAGLLD